MSDFPDGDLDEVLVALRQLAIQSTTPGGHTLVEDQLATLATRLNRGSRVFTLRAPGQNGYKGAELLTIDLSEVDDMGKPLDGKWVVPQAFQKVQIESTLRVIEPFPSLLLMGSYGPFMTATDGQEMDLPEGVMVVRYQIDAVVFASGDQQRFTQRRSILMATAFLRAVRLDESLGGLVYRIHPRGTVEPGGGGRYGKNPSVMAARVRLEAFATLPY